ncbi:recombinase RecA [Candidatus Kuenenbacteria bacterium]|nr:recombinase RecA [Candidatus Kuenenbacteria bacterium]
MPKKEESMEAKGGDKLKAAELAMEQIKEKYGEGAIMKFGEIKKLKVPVIPMGCLSMDLALGVGGLPKGRIIEIYGAEASGKTTLSQHAIASVQRSGGVAAFVDAEHALDPDYAKKIGVKVDELLISQPDSGEQALEIVETLVRSGGVDLIVVDSVAALTPRVEIEGEMGQSHMGLQARLMSQALRKLTAVISKTETTVIFLNQTRQKIGVVFGNPETTTGGMALKFYASVRIELRRAAQIKMGENFIGNRVKAKIVKNKVAPPFKTCEFDIMYNEGISMTADVLDRGVEEGIVKKMGNSFIYEETKLGVGRENAKRFLKENVKLTREIAGKIWNKVKEDEGREN